MFINLNYVIVNVGIEIFVWRGLELRFEKKNQGFRQMVYFDMLGEICCEFSYWLIGKYLEGLEVIMVVVGFI